MTHGRSLIAVAVFLLVTAAGFTQSTAGAAASDHGARALSLSDAIRLAVEASQSLERGDLEIDAARAGLDRANAAFGPLISGSAGVAFLGDPPEGISIPAGEFGTANDPTSTFPTLIPDSPVVLVPDAENLGLSVSVQLDQTLFTWGKLEAGREAATAEIDATTSRKAQSERDLRRSVSLAFAGVLAGRDSVRLLREAVTLLEARVADAQERFDAGAITRSGVLAEQASLATLRTQLVRTEQGLRSAEASLEWLVGEPVEELAAISLPDALPAEDELVAAAIAGDPSLSELRARSTQAEVQLRVAEASRPWLPDIGLSVSAEVQGQRIPFLQANWIDSWDADLTISIGASASLYDSGANAADQASAQAQYGQTLSAIAEYEAALPLQIRAEVESFLVAQARAEETRIRRETAVEQERIAVVSFENELITRADVLGAQAAVIEADLTAIAVELERAQAFFDVEYLAGPIAELR